MVKVSHGTGLVSVIVVALANVATTCAQSNELPPRPLAERIRTLVNEGFPSAAAAFDTEQKIAANDGAAGDEFGVAVAISGDTAIVGAGFDDDSGSASGSAYVYRRDQGGVDNWGLVTKITASDAVADTLFGDSVAISGDTAIVGARIDTDNATQSGSVYVYRRDEGGVDNWGEVIKITVSDGASLDNFGSSVAIAGDTVIVGAHAEDDNGEDSGSAYVYRRDEGGVDNWGLVTKITANDAAIGDRFGTSVAISGDTGIVGARGGGGPIESGWAYVFQRDAGGIDNWGQVTKITASDGAVQDGFGNSVTISGDTAMVGAFGDDDNGSASGSVYVYRRDEGGPNNWGEVIKFNANDGVAGDRFGRSVAIRGDTAIVGAFGDDDNGVTSGSAYVYRADEGGVDNWGQIIKITAGDGVADDQFGRSVALSGGTAIVGARFGDGNETDSGSAYLFFGSVCGNGMVELGEVCDDGNTDDCDGCRGDCSAVEGTCGDGVLDTVCEVCDDGNTDDCDGCRGDCSAVEGTCGDGVFDTVCEVCDDGNTFDCDGCRGDCSAVEGTCGDGTPDTLCETCDDGGNNGTGEGFCILDCSAFQICGDDVPNGTEECDDTNPESDDGCSSDCQIEDFEYRILLRIDPPVEIETGDNFGFSTDLTDGGRTAIVGAPLHDDGEKTDAGAAYVFHAPPKGLEELPPATIRLEVVGLAADDQFGYSVAIHDKTAIVGAPFRNDATGAAFVFRRHEERQEWAFVAEITADDGRPGDQFGFSVDVGVPETSGGETKFVAAIVGAPGATGNTPESGAAYVFEVEQAERFQIEQWVNGPGNQVMMLFALDTGLDGDKFGFSVAIKKNVAIVGAPFHDENGDNSGAAYFYNRNVPSRGAWSLVDKFCGGTAEECTDIDQEPGAEFGTAVDFSNGTATVGAPGINVVWRFAEPTRTVESWSPNGHYSLPPMAASGTASARFGASVAISGDTAAIGAPGDDSVHVYRRNEGGIDNWGAVASVTASDGVLGDQFGFSVAISGITVIAGAFLNDENGEDSGAAYLIGSPGAPGACCHFDGSCEDSVFRSDCLAIPTSVWTKSTLCEETVCTAIPTVSEWGLVVMTLLGCTAGTIIFGRRQRAAKGRHQPKD